jgi:hypothetical protein
VICLALAASSDACVESVTVMRYHFLVFG